MKTRCCIFSFAFATFFASQLYAQDPQLSQYYAAPLYLNPSFAGNTLQSRLIANYRHQWAAIPGAFISYAFSYDHNLQGINSGAGFMAMHDKAGTGGLRFTNLAGFYAYTAQLNRKLVLKPGVSFSYTFRNINFADLTFGDQLIHGGGNSSENPVEPVSYVDAAAGLLLYSEKFWFGSALHHLNKPNQSLVGGITRLPIKFSI
ncbi:MAG: PorP/SprF family type IX secretion system membrane protein, partial [Flavobacteriales bacterium]